MSPEEAHAQLDRVVEQLREPLPQLAAMLEDAIALDTHRLTSYFVQPHLSLGFLEALLYAPSLAGLPHQLRRDRPPPRAKAYLVCHLPGLTSAS